MYQVQAKLNPFKADWYTMATRNPIHDGGYEVVEATAQDVRQSTLCPVRVVREDGSVAMTLP